jgi:hypothetical protein
LASTPTRLITAVCMSGSMRRMGTCGGSACCARAGTVAAPHAISQMNSTTRIVMGHHRTGI